MARTGAAIGAQPDVDLAAARGTGAQPEQRARSPARGKGRGEGAAQGSGKGHGQGKAGPSDVPAPGAEEPAEPAGKGGKRARWGCAEHQPEP